MIQLHKVEDWSIEGVNVLKCRVLGWSGNTWCR